MARSSWSICPAVSPTRIPSTSSRTPAEVRGEFKPISTNVPGIQICEHLPRLARCTDKLAILRSIVGQIDEHSSFQSTTGYPMNITQRDGKPHFGSVVARLQGPVDPVVPPFIDLFPTMQHRPYNSPAGHLGHAPCRSRSTAMTWQ
ncbi:MAG: DUF1501 domain-containing protein [Gemmataceae bacterium]